MSDPILAATELEEELASAGISVPVGTAGLTVVVLLSPESAWGVINRLRALTAAMAVLEEAIRETAGTGDLRADSEVEE